MAARGMTRCVLVAALLAVAGCSRDESSRKATTESASAGPSIRFLADESKLLEELLGVKAYVYAFSGTFLSVSVEGEVTNAETNENKPFASIPLEVARGHFPGRTGPMAEKLAGKIVVLRNRDDRSVRCRLLAKLPEVVGLSSSLYFEYSLTIPEFPEEKGAARGGWTSLGDTPAVVTLPTEPGQECTVFWFGEERIGHNGTAEPGKITRLGRTEVRVRATRLPDEIPETIATPDDSTAVGALARAGATVRRNDRGSVYEAVFTKDATDTDLSYLKGLPNLERVSLPKTVTDSGLALVGELTRLRYLSMDSPQVTDTGLLQLSSLARLEVLDVGKSPVTKTGKEKLKALLPKVRIVPDVPVTPAKKDD